jgi:hypothetical protein
MHAAAQVLRHLPKQIAIDGWAGFGGVDGEMRLRGGNHAYRNSEGSKAEGGKKAAHVKISLKSRFGFGEALQDR